MSDESVQMALSRTVLSTIDEPGALGRLWDDFVGVIRARLPARLAEADALCALAGHGADWLANRRGAQGVWPYTDTERFRAHLQAVLLAKITGDVPEQVLSAFRFTARQLHLRRSEPYPACHLVCTQDPPVCLYRAAVTDMVRAGRHRASWHAADAFDAGSEDKRRRQTWEVCQDAAYELVEFPDPDLPTDVSGDIEIAARRVCMCFEQQMLSEDRTKVPRTSRRILARVIAEAGL
jgi:hypothetical protein